MYVRTSSVVLLQNICSISFPNICVISPINNTTSLTGFNRFILNLLQYSHVLQQCQLIRQWLTVYSQLSVPFCTARRNYTAAQYAISRQLKTRSFNSVSFVTVRSGTAVSPVINFAFNSASRTVSRPLHKLYCSSELCKYRTDCSTMFCSIPIKQIHKLGHLLSAVGRHFIPFSPTVIHFGELRDCSEDYSWCCSEIWLRVEG